MEYTTDSKQQQEEEEQSTGPFGLSLGRGGWRGRHRYRYKTANPVTAVMMQELEELAVTEEDVPVSQAGRQTGWLADAQTDSHIFFYIFSLLLLLY